MEKDASTRMGAPMSQHEDICESDFFYDIDWRRLEKRQLPPPFKPQVVSTVCHSTAASTTDKKNTHFCCAETPTGHAVL